VTTNNNREKGEVSLRARERESERERETRKVFEGGKKKRRESGLAARLWGSETRERWV
jgi:hypothetical protein